MKTIAKTHNETNRWQEMEDRRGEEWGKGAGQLQTENWSNINEHQRKTCNLQLGRQWKHRELATAKLKQRYEGGNEGEGFSICIVCKMLQVNYAELQQQWQKVKVKRTTKWNLHWLSLLSTFHKHFS